MLTIISTILGFLSSAFPEIIKYFKTKQDYAHEKEMYTLQVESMKTEHEFKMREMEATADIKESEALYKASEIKLTGWVVVDGIIALYNSSVRPTLTYAFLTLYGLAKFGQYQVTVASSASPSEAIWKVYNTEDMALFAAIVGYWFGQRGMKYTMEHMGVTNANSIKSKP